MFSWSQFFPFSLPSLSLSVPLNIQRRFISFILKRTLGHLVRPGQLDTHQIDAQIGNGWIEISDIELSDEAINELISDLPLRLRKGSIGKISAQIPWSNILSSPLQATIHGLHLEFILRASPVRNVSLAHGLDLSASVTNVAETFIHEELDPHENRKLRDSIVLGQRERADVSSPGWIPGSMDPFLPADDEIVADDIDAEEVSVLASLTERLLSRLKVSVTGTSISVSNESVSEIMLSIPEVTYGVESHSQEHTNSSESSSEARIIRISSLKIAMNDLLHRASAFPSYDTDASDDSDDENAQMLMSQSIISLPPSSSIYHSAISLPHPPTRPFHSHIGSTLVSIGDPIVIQFSSFRPSQLSPPTPTSSEETPPSAPPSPTSTVRKNSVGVQLNIVACALQGWQCKALLDILHFVPSSSSSKPSTPASTPRDAFEFGLQLRSFVVLLTEKPLSTSAALDAFFVRPFSPLSGLSHIRLQLDHLNISNLTKPSSPTSAAPHTDLRVTLTEANIFHITSRGSSYSSKEENWTTSPILIFDPNLSPSPSGSRRGAEMFPFLPITDQWERPLEAHLKPSLWRSPANQSAVGSKRSGKAPHVFTLTKSTSVPTINSPLAVDLEPIHIFLDFEVLSGIVSLINEINASSHGETRDDDSEGSDGDDNDYMEPVQDDVVQETPRPRKLDLPDEEYGRPPVSDSSSPGVAILQVPVIRIELRIPPSGSKRIPKAPRSGALLIDLYGLVVAVGPSGSVVRPPLSGHKVPQFGPSLLSVEWDTLLIAFGNVGESRASTWLTIGPLGSTPLMAFAEPQDVSESIMPVEVPLPPRLVVSKREVFPKAGSTSPPASHVLLECSLPYLRVSLHKNSLDGLQFWADDVTQWAEQLSEDGSNLVPEDSSDSTLVGSRFFARHTRSTASSTTVSEAPSGAKEETPTTRITIAVFVTEASARLWVPRLEDGTFLASSARPMDVMLSDISASCDVRPEGKNETIVRVSIMDIKMTDTSANELSIPMLHLTKPHTMISERVPMVQLRFASVPISDAIAKESRVKVTLSGFTFNLSSDIAWIQDLSNFAKAPEGAFESVIPSERTVLSVYIVNGSIQLRGSKHPGAVIVSLNEADFSTVLVGISPEVTYKIRMPSIWLLCLDDLQTASPRSTSKRDPSNYASTYWQRAGFAPLIEIGDLTMHVRRNTGPLGTLNKVEVFHLNLSMYACADSLTAMAAVVSDFSSAFSSPDVPHTPVQRAPPMVGRNSTLDLFASLDEHAFRKAPEFGATADMVLDDLPTNLEYIDASYGSAAGFRDVTEDDLEGYDEGDVPFYQPSLHESGVISMTGGETIRIIDPQGVHPIEGYFSNLAPQDRVSVPDDTDTSIRIHDCNVTLSLYAGYDWERTRNIVDAETKAMRRKLLKIRQLLANGQTPDESAEDTYTVLFNSVYIGLPPDVDALEPSALIAAIDQELNDDLDETASQSSWQSLHRGGKPTSPGGGMAAERARGSRLSRSRNPSLEFCFKGVNVEMDIYRPDNETASRLLVTIKDVEILDHIKTSTWKKFLTQMREDFKGNVRETDSNMVRVELISVRPVRSDPSEEARLRAKILPLRLHVDQDALDFIKKFFAFSDSTEPEETAPQSPPSKEIYFQHVDVFPVELKLDYKPKRVDYHALREGKTIELMNFFHFDGSEMTLRHIEMFGVTGWTRMLDMLNDLWTPDVKANQLADVISGVEPIRSLVNVGSGVADLVLLPIAQYKKDGRIIRGVQKGTTSFVKSTAMEAIKLGAKLANGTQIILEQAETVLSGREGVERDAGQDILGVVAYSSDEEEQSFPDLSRYAEQPGDVKEGLRSAYKSLGKNLNSAAQTILAVPMEVYERSGTEGPVRAVVRAVPIAVLKPMIGASEAVSKTLLGLRNTLDPNVRRDSDEKYKRR